MVLNRRAALKLAGTTILASALGPVFARPKPSRVLILGGTGFIGPHFVDALTKGGHTLTLFNRGKRDPEARPGIEQLLGDRDGQIDALKGRDWDVVIDNSGYKPKQVQLTADLLQGHVKQYIFISSIAAYADFAKVGIDEDYKLAQLKDPAATDTVIGDTYGPLKVLCEQIVEKAYGSNATIIRPTYIAGPGDVTDRFTYWPLRVSRGGDMLAPGTPKDPFQFIDVRDLADFIRICVEKHVTGRYNICDAQGSVTMGSLLETSKRVTGANTNFVWANVEFLRAQGLLGNDLFGPGDFPLWAPATGDAAGLALVSPARAVKQGLKFRSLEVTIRDTLAWQKTRAEDKQKLRTGMTMEKEAEVLAKLRAG